MRAADPDWLELCRRSTRAVQQAIAALPTALERSRHAGFGLGGDETTAIDAAAEAAVVGVLEGLHADGTEFTLVSEELGERVFGSGESSLRLVVDPIDGSMNAKRCIPFFSLSIAIAQGDTIGDVFFGYVYDLGSGEEWWARRGEGAFLDSARLEPLALRDGIELLAFEATKTEPIARHALAMVGMAERLRVMGSLALLLCHFAAGRVDAVCSLKEARSVDIAAAQLLVREQGLAIDLPQSPSFLAAPLDVVGRSIVVAGRDGAVCAELSRLLLG